MSDERTCTCHPDDRPEKCPQKFAASECRTASTIESLQARVRELEEAGKQAQKALALMIDPKSYKTTTSIIAFAICTEAELAVRTALGASS